MLVQPTEIWFSVPPYLCLYSYVWIAITTVEFDMSYFYGIIAKYFVILSILILALFLANTICWCCSQNLKLGENCFFLALKKLT